jgi:hypothetical protein
MVLTKKEEKIVDSKKTLEKYVKPSPVLSVIGVILLAAALVMLAMSFISSNNVQKEAGNPVLLDTMNTETDAYVYVDVVGISNWLYKEDGDTYYTILDADWNMYTARVSDSDYKKMTPQFDYMMSEDEDAQMPEPYRLKGICRKATSDIRSYLSQSWEIKTSEYTTLFGTMYLDATSKPGDDVFFMWLVGVLLSGLFSLVFFTISIPANVNFNRCVKALERENLLDQAANELENPEIEKIGKDCGRLSRRFLYGKGTGAVIPYSDIQWIYRREVKRYAVITVNVQLVVATNKINEMVVLNFSGKNKDEEFMKIYATVAQQNPEVLVGFTGENKRQYQMRKQAACVE